MKSLAPRLKSVPLAVALLVGTASGTTWAAPVSYGKITLDATYSLNGGPSVDGMSTGSINSDFSWADPTATGADLYLSDSAGDSNIFFHTYGVTGASTYFGARVSGQGVFSASTRASYNDTITNTSATAQAFNFSFNVDSSELGMYGVGDALALSLIHI